jgi:hypothetical protein
LLGNLALTDAQKEDARTKRENVTQCLNQTYYQASSGITNILLVGSWGKGTMTRPPRDIDLLFSLPRAVYDRFQQRVGNKQSALLQEVKSVLLRRFSSTDISGDGQVVVIPFSSYKVEVVPAFSLTSGQYLICDTNNGGRYKTIDPNAEITHVQSSNSISNGNTRDLIRMLKCWQEYCSVPIKSFVLELLVVEFLSTWEHRGKSAVYYDWMTRDFFKFLCGKYSWSSVTVPGIGESIALGDEWQSRAESALARAQKACGYEAEKKTWDAGQEWLKIFGAMMPIGG